MKYLNNTLLRITRLRASATGIWLAMLCSPMVQAALPQPTQVGGAPASGDFMTQMRDYMGVGVGLFALVLAAFSFVLVPYAIVTKFNEYRIGKADFGDVKTISVVGGLVLLLVLFFCAKAVDVIAISAIFAGATP